jgi:hypothetical protein
MQLLYIYSNMSLDVLNWLKYMAQLMCVAFSSTLIDIAYKSISSSLTKFYSPK